MFLVLWVVVPRPVSGQDTVPPGLAQVGETCITDQDIHYRTAIEQVYSGTCPAREKILVVLIQDALNREMLRREGLSVTREDLDGFSRHADESSRAPEILARVKAVFGDDTEAYRRIYLAPRLINQKLRHYHSRNPDLHVRSRVMIETALKKVSQGTPLETVAGELTLQYGTLEYASGESQETVNPDLPGELTHPGELLKPLVEPLQPGDVYGTIIETDTGYQVMQVVTKTPEKFTVALITARKYSYEKWFRKEVGMIPISILDPKMDRAIRSGYPDLWWVGR